MPNSLSNVVSLQWVSDRLQDPNVLLADCRFILGNPGDGRKAYNEAHLPGAVYFDLEEDLSAPKDIHGGRHPLPDLEVLTAKLGKAGIDDSVTVVAYDDQGGANASRLWWLLRFLGHKNAFIMDGGFQQWEQAEYPVSAADSDPASRSPRTWTPQIHNEWLAGVEEVREKLGSSGTVLIDSRELKRYLGEEEPIDPVAGHIPGAVNLLWKENLTEKGLWKSLPELRDRFGGIARDKEIIVYCGSGVTACPNVLALAEAGYSDVKLYLGSWSDWISYEENPIATGEE